MHHLPRAQILAPDAEQRLNRLPFWILFPRVSLSTVKVICDCMPFVSL